MLARGGETDERNRRLANLHQFANRHAKAETLTRAHAFGRRKIIIIGIDPGLDGAAALISHTGFLDLFDLPSVVIESKGRNRRKIDAVKLAYLVRDAMLRHGLGEHVEVWLEDVHAMPSSKSGSAANTSLMHTKGVIEGVAGALGLSVYLVPAQRWKAKFGLGADKGDAIEHARAIYPNAPLTLKKHHNRAEACLIARHGLRERL